MKVQLIIPVFNEAESLGELSRRLGGVLSSGEAADVSYSVVFIDDGSSDATPRMLAEMRDRDPRFGYLRLSRNFGHQAAISAGLDHADADAVVVMDGDLQDPPELVPEMVSLWRKEAVDVVYGVRRNRKESWVKRACYAAFYRLFRWMTRVPLPADAGDFGLMSRRVYAVLRELPERVRFLRGLRFWVGFRQAPLEYDRPARLAGDTKYAFSSLYKLATDGLASFSILPLRIAQFFSFVLGMATLCVLAVLLLRRPTDALSMLTVMGFISCLSFSMLFLCLYVLGAYVSRVYQEIKRRPLYIVSDSRLPSDPG